MDDATKRMLLLGRQAPPKAMDLKLEPRTYVSPNHAPVADVSYRVEKHIPVHDPGNKAERKAKQEIQERPRPNGHLEEFQHRVRMRAAKVQKDMREQQQQRKQQLQAKKESLDRRKAYARRVSAANTLAFKKHKEAVEESSSESDYSDSSCDENSDSEGEDAPTEHVLSQPPTISGTLHTATKQLGPPTLQDPYNPPPTVKIVKGPSKEPPRQPSPQPQKKTIPPAARVKRQAVDASGIWRPAKGAQCNSMSCSSAEEPCAPPQQVLDHVRAVKRHEELYHGALTPMIVSDDQYIATHGRGKHGQQEYGPCQHDASQRSPPHYALQHQNMHPGASGRTGDLQHTPRSHGTFLREEEDLTSPEMIALWQRQCEDLDVVREETRAQSSNFSGTELGTNGYLGQIGIDLHGTPYQGVGGYPQGAAVDFSQLCPHSGPPGLHLQAFNRSLPSPTPSISSQPVLDREAGGGTGLAGKVSPVGVGAHWCSVTEPMHDRTNVPGMSANPISCEQSAWTKFAAGAAECMDGRSDDELPLCGAFTKQHVSEGNGQVEQMQLRLPQMCACHDVSVLDPHYTSYCHPTCQFYENEERFSLMLKGLLETWGIIEP